MFLANSLVCLSHKGAIEPGCGPFKSFVTNFDAGRWLIWII